MAGEDNSSKIEHVLQCWMLDYICYRAWNEYSQNDELNSDTIDSIQGVINRASGDGPRVKKLFLCILCRLNDADNVVNVDEYGSEASQEASHTILEDMLDKFMELINHQKHDILNEGTKLIEIIKTEAVIVCCRRGDFVLGKEVFKRLYPKPDKTNKMREILKYMLDFKKDTDLNGFPYKNFITAMLKYLGLIYSQFNTPMVVEAARHLVEGHAGGTPADGEDGVKQTNRPCTNKRFKLDVLQKAASSMEQDNNNADEGHTLDKPRVHKLWNNNLQELFGSSESIGPDSEKPSSTSDVFCRPGTPLKTKSSSVRNVSPICSSPYRAENMRYRKNEGRPNRHEAGTRDSTKVSERRKSCGSSDNESNAPSLSESMISRSGTTRKKKWTYEEMVDFYDAVKTIGVGKWSEIKEYLDTTRTGVMLKDKWRNMLKSGDCDKIEDKKKMGKTNKAKT